MSKSICFISHCLACFVCVSLHSFVHCSASASDYQLLSPDQRTAIHVSVNESISFSVLVNETPVISGHGIGLEIDGQPAGLPVVQRVERQLVDKMLTPVLPLKNAQVKDHYHAMTLTLANSRAIEFRAYNNGIAYRHRTSLEGRILVKSEHAHFQFPQDLPVYYSEEKKAPRTQGEQNYTRKNLSVLSPKTVGYLPLLSLPKQGTKVLITESDLFDYPGLWLKPTGKRGFHAFFPQHVSEITRTKNGVNSIVATDDFIAQTQGTRSYPWRIFILANNDRELLENELVFNLSRPNEIQDSSWIKPGKMAWEWWNHINLTGVDFEAGINTKTYKYFIDFAEEYGLELVVLDAGWYKVGDIFDWNPDIDLDELAAYAQKKKVGLVLRVIWRDVDDQHEKAFAQFEKWGIAGLKVDQMQRDDQEMVNYYWRVARQAAKHKILINFHGNYKPAGLHRAYPNVITREGVKGLEWVKWSKDVTPEHNVTIPFIRMVIGPMDYTPGAMLNASEKNFRIMNERPMSMGTRVHQMAMYVIYESPQSTLADTPVHYRQDPECARFMADTPETWDETVALGGEIGKYVLMARRKGESWYVGAMTGTDAIDLEIDLSFLNNGTYRLESYQDGINVHLNASDYQRKTKNVTQQETLPIHLSAGGGWVGKLNRVQE